MKGDVCGQLSNVAGAAEARLRPRQNTNNISFDCSAPEQATAKYGVRFVSSTLQRLMHPVYYMFSSSSQTVPHRSALFSTSEIVRLLGNGPDSCLYSPP